SSDVRARARTSRPSLGPQRVQVVGAGLGGMAAAVALARSGAEVEVVERATALGEVGAGIQLSPNAVKALRWLGVSPESASPFRPEAVELRLFDSGRTVYRLPLGDAATARWGAPYLQVHRADLHAVLTAAAREAGVHLRLGVDATGYEVTKDGAEARLMLRALQDPAVPCAAPSAAPATERRAKPRPISLHRLRDAAMPLPEPEPGAPMDLIVAADGVRSALREQMQMLAGGPADAFSGNVAFRGTVRADALPPGLLRPVGSVWMGPQRHFVHYFIRGGTLVNFVAVCERNIWTPESWSTPGDITALRAEFAGWHPTVRAILDAAESTYEWGLFGHAPLARWNDGPVALLGDAAHPTTPFLAQGAAMAFEDAVTLARTLPVYGVRYGIEAYHKLRAPRTAALQAAAAKTGRRFHSNSTSERMAKAAAIAALGILAPSVAAGLNDWIYDHDAGSAPV
ncbi:MAG: salicylate hydroxylase, partial [Paracoccaceae bacterium]